MRRIFLILILTSITSAAWSSNWDRAVEIYGETSRLKPYKMNIHSKTFDGQGRLEKTEEQFFILDYNEDSEFPESELILAIEDGRDITVQKRKEYERNHNMGGPPPGVETEGMDLMPLDPGEQHRVSPAYSGRTEYKNGTRCEVWNFEAVLNDKHKGVGTVWINSETGAALSMEYSIEPLFPFVEDMSIGMEFSSDHLNRWVLDKFLMDGRVNFLVMKRTFNTVTEFSDYR